MLPTMLPSHVGNDVAGVTWSWRDLDIESCWRQCCRVMLTTVLSSHAGDDAVRATWPRRHEDIESCWRQCYRVMLTVVRLRSPRDQSIDVLSYREKVGYSC
jgi:hypothetical protein